VSTSSGWLSKTAINSSTLATKQPMLTDKFGLSLKTTSSFDVTPLQSAATDSSLFPQLPTLTTCDEFDDDFEPMPSCELFCFFQATLLVIAKHIGWA